MERMEKSSTIPLLFCSLIAIPLHYALLMTHSLLALVVALHSLPYIIFIRSDRAFAVNKLSQDTNYVLSFNIKFDCSKKSPRISGKNLKPRTLLEKIFIASPSPSFPIQTLIRLGTNWTDILPVLGSVD